jgi:hypothetical protein
MRESTRSTEMGKRRRVLEVCARRCRGCFEAGMADNSARVTVEHVSNDAVFYYGAELRWWIEFDRLGTSRLHLSEIPCGVGRRSL